jgi:hypothetical protein
VLKRKVYKALYPVLTPRTGTKMDLVSKIELILEWGTLKKVELPSGLIGIKKEAEGSVISYRNEALKIVIDSYRKRYPLLEKVIQGETTFEKQYKPLINKYTGIENFFFPTRLTEKETKIPRENKELIHDYGLSDKTNALSKPVSWTTLGLAMAYTVSTIFGLTYGNVAHTNVLLYGATGFCFLLGMGCSEGVYKHKKLLKKDIKLLDEQIKEVYQKS